MRVVLQALGMVFYPLIVHLLIELDRPWLAVAGLVATSAIYLTLLVGLQRRSGAHPAWLGLYLGLAVLGVINLLTHAHWALFFPPVIINLAIGTIFALTLRPGSTPLVTQMMRFEYRGELPPAPVTAYGRRLTIIWVAFFAGVALLSVVLALTAPLNVWSLFTNILNYVFAVLLLFAQFFYRWLRYRQYGVFMPWDTLRGMVRQPWPGRGAPIVGGGRAAK